MSVLHSPAPMYWLFAGRVYGSNRGSEDLVGIYPTLEAAQAAYPHAQASWHDYWGEVIEVINNQPGRVWGWGAKGKWEEIPAK